MISVAIQLIREGQDWRIHRCAVNVGNNRIRACAAPSRKFGSEVAATNAMKRRVMEYLRLKGHTDSPVDIAWHVEVIDAPDSPRNPTLYST
jgi:hypothetical protein